MLVDAGGEGDGNEEPKIVCCDVRRENVDEVRERMPIQAHRTNSYFSW